jgi:hypothetical protein
MEQALLVFAIAVLIWLGTSASRGGKATELPEPHGAQRQAGDHHP